jgi:hypothetical protein
MLDYDMQVCRWVQTFRSNVLLSASGQSTGIKFSWSWKAPLLRLGQMDYWWRTGGANGFSGSLFEALREKKKNNNNNKKKKKKK